MDKIGIRNLVICALALSAVTSVCLGATPDSFEFVEVEVPGATDIFLQDINESGVATGTVVLDGLDRAFIWDSRTNSTTILSGTATESGFGFEINSFGDVAGQADFTAALWGAGSVTPTQTDFNGSTFLRAQSVSDSGEILLQPSNTLARPSVFRSDGTLDNLQAPTGPGYATSGVPSFAFPRYSAVSINSSGFVVGSAFASGVNDMRDAIIWNPEGIPTIIRSSVNDTTFSRGR